MARRIFRTITQVSAAAIVTLVTLFFLDRNFRVLPSSIHEYLPQHHPGLVITDITITKCSSLKLFSSCKLEGADWHRIEKDLFLGKTYTTSSYLHIQRKKEEELTPDDKVVMDVTVGRLDPGASVKGQADERWESRPEGLWIKRSAKKGASDSKQAVTGVDVLFGDDAVEARDGWTVVGVPLLLDSGSIPSAHITIRRGSQQPQPKPQPRIRDNGKFKILQLADLHLSTGVGACREAVPNEYNGGKCEADPRTLDFVNKMLDEEKPDMVVLSGDQVNGDTAPDAQSALFKIASILAKRKIPYTAIFGNHDDEGSLPRSAQMSLLETLPYSLSRAGPEDLDGVGNYYVEVLARGKSSHSALTVYFLDTHAYSPDEKKFKGYDWLKKNQVDWFAQTAASLKPKHREYTHVHMDVAFIHIPLPEYREPALYESPARYFTGTWREAPTAPVFNSGFRDALVEQGVVMVSCGHDHANEYCAMSVKKEDEAEEKAAAAEGKESKKKPAPKAQPELWMCYAGGAGFGGYGGYGGFLRKVRVFDFDFNEARISTWKRVESGDEVGRRIDEQIIVDGGRPVAPREGVEGKILLPGLTKPA